MKELFDREGCDPTKASDTRRALELLERVATSLTKENETYGDVIMLRVTNSRERRRLSRTKHPEPEEEEEQEEGEEEKKQGKKKEKQDKTGATPKKRSMNGGELPPTRIRTRGHPVTPPHIDPVPSPPAEEKAKPPPSTSTEEEKFITTSPAVPLHSPSPPHFVLPPLPLDEVATTMAAINNAMTATVPTEASINTPEFGGFLVNTPFGSDGGLQEFPGLFPVWNDDSTLMSSAVSFLPPPIDLEPPSSELSAEDFFFRCSTPREET